MLLIESLEVQCTECLDLAGASVKCEAAMVIVSRRETCASLTFDLERGASLWAEKIALACGHTESIAKLLSMQRHRINSLEQRSMETSSNKDEVERCLNFLSREYVEMRYQVRKGEPKESAEKLREENCSGKLAEPIAVEKQGFEPETEPNSKAGSPRIKAPRALREAQRSPKRLGLSPKREEIERKGHRLVSQRLPERRTARSSGRN